MAVWKPPNGHPLGGIPYTLPRVERGVGGDESAALIAEWIRRVPGERAWAAPYVG